MRGVAGCASASSCGHGQRSGGVHDAEMPPVCWGHFSLLTVTRAGQLWARSYSRSALIGLRQVVRRSRGIEVAAT